MFKSLSTSLIARGILALAVGVIALAWPSVTVLVQGLELRRTGKTLHPVKPGKPAKPETKAA